MSTDQIKKLREKTSLSIMLCKRALENSGGDELKALDWLKQQGVEMAEKKFGRSTGAGLIETYVHADGRIGVLLEMKSETDFVAKNPDFKKVAHDVAMQIAASDPVDVKNLLEQPFIKDLRMTVSDYVNQAVQKFGENIEISRFERYEI